MYKMFIAAVRRYAIYTFTPTFIQMHISVKHKKLT